MPESKITGVCVAFTWILDIDDTRSYRSRGLPLWKHNFTLISIIFLSTTSPLLSKTIWKKLLQLTLQNPLGKLCSVAAGELCSAWGLKADLAHLGKRLKAINDVLSNAIILKKSCMMRRTCWTNFSAKLCEGGWWKIQEVPAERYDVCFQVLIRLHFV